MQVIIIMQDLYFENRISFVVVCPTHVFSIALKGIFPKAAFKYIPYTQTDQLVVDIQDYKIHMAFPVNGAVAQLIQAKGIVISKVFQLQRSWAPPVSRDSFRIAILSARAYLLLPRTRKLSSHTQPRRWPLPPPRYFGAPPGVLNLQLS